jgi:DNA-binding NtrC family response regulator
MHESLSQRLALILSVCRRANTEGDPRPLVALITHELAALMATLGPPVLVGGSAKMRHVVRLIENIRGSAANVLLTGERGTGKQHAANVIHASSLRARGPFVVLTCASAPATGLAATLHRARGGSLFLKEISYLRSAAQTEILRALEEPEIDVRFLAGSSRDLEAEAAKGNFRRDLYYRLKVIQIPLPPLREIPEDVPPLANYFLAQFCQDWRREPMAFSAAVLDRLARSAWPGNAQQLRAEVRRLAFGAQTRTIIGEQDGRRVRAFLNAVADLEKLLIAEALEASSHNQQQAARYLGLSRQGLINKMKRYGFNRANAMIGP